MTVPVHTTEELLRADALSSIEYLHGIEDFKEWFSKEYEFFDRQMLHVALKAWIESKSRMLNRGVK